MFLSKLGHETLSMDSLVRVTDLERTIIDCLDRLDRAGGVEEFIHSLAMINHSIFSEEELKSLRKVVIFYLAVGGSNSPNSHLYTPELLFNSLDILERIKQHPMVIWKTGVVR